MMDALQTSYFANTPYEVRRAWILGDACVRAREERVIAELRTRAKRLPRGARVIEVGCGEGINLQLLQEALPEHGIVSVGYDACLEAVEAGQRAGVDTRHADGLSVPEPDATADIVFCRDVLHHLPSMESRVAFIREMERLVKPGGAVIIIEPNAFHPLIFLQQFVQPAERGVRAIHERALRTLLPTEVVVRRQEPSLLWRLVYHYRLPALWRRVAYSTPGQWKLRVWEKVSTTLVPSFFWGYRTYVWNRSR